MSSTIVEKYSRLVEKVVEAKEQAEGLGARVRRSLGRTEIRSLDPFLLLDHFNVSVPGGFPDHPHRGFETVTYMLEGSFKHEDFLGNMGVINTGDVQWMTAGRGIIHSEMPGPNGGNGIQLWVNLPKKDKMVKPEYQDLRAKDIPIVEHNNVKAVIIAGECMGVKGKATTKIPIHFVDLTLSKGDSFIHRIPDDWNACCYVIAGKILIGPEDNQTLGISNHLLVLGHGISIEFKNKENEPARFILLAGQPINEPVVQHGPFVMTSDEEISQTIKDYHDAKNGFEKKVGFKSKAIK